MMIRWLVLLLFLFVFHLDVAAYTYSESGGRSKGLGGASIGMFDFWSAIKNNAGLASYEDPALGISYENRFLINELSTNHVGAILPFHYGVFGLSMSYYGFDLFNKKKIGLAFARNYGKRFSAGLQFDYIGIRLGNEYGRKDIFTFEIGSTFLVNKKLSVGIHLFNPHNSKISEQYHERYPAVIRFGIKYCISERIISVLEFEKISNYNPLYRIGLEYNPSGKVFLRTGISSNPFQNSFGAGFKLGNLIIDIASSFIPAFGFISEASIIFEFNRERKKSKS